MTSGGASVCRTHVAIDAAECVTLGGAALTPGMQGEAMILVGERTFWQYTAQPLLDSFARAFREQEPSRRSGEPVMADRLPTLFCDGIIEANVTHGVVRITLGQVMGDGKAIPCGQVILPLAQLAGTATAMANLVKQVQERIQEATSKAQAAAPDAGQAPSAFKFS
jgi:hypothetical protein